MIGNKKIGVLIDPEAFAEVWVGLVNEKDEMDDVFAKFLISHREEDREFSRYLEKIATLLPLYQFYKLKPV